MKNIQGIQLIMESNEELLPDFFMDFPYICSCVEFDKYIDPVVPWHCFSVCHKLNTGWNRALTASV